MKFFVFIAPSLVQIVELALVIAAVGMIFLRHRKPGASPKEPRGLRQVENAFSKLARRKIASGVFVFLLALVTRAALIPILGIPEPHFNDEFMFVLQGDTFAHGRITNPTHPMWVHFESFHIILHPSYTGMYPPMQGLVLATGEILGHPWIGQWLTTALMCATFYWMLLAWLPPGWALLGGVLAVLRIGILSYWMNTYWCASVAALGGALVMGALPRLKKHARVRDACLMAIGLAVLANSRPYEGLVFSLPIAVAMLIWLTGRNRPAMKVALASVVVPIVLILSAAAVATGYYYYRVTGSPFKMSYEVNRETYAMTPYFLWFTPRPEPVYRHPVMKRYYEWELQQFEVNRTLVGYFSRSWDKFVDWWRFYLGVVFLIPLLAFHRILHDRRMRIPLVVMGCLILGFAVQTWTLPHYFSPAACLLYLVLLQGMRHIRLWQWRGNPTGAAIVRAIPVICIALIVMRVGAVGLHAQIEPAWPRGNLDRVAVLHYLEHAPGRHLVLVRYENPNHQVNWEWVYNNADIDDSKVVWARDMGDRDNQEILHYFHDRKAWMIDGDHSPPVLEPYRPTPPPSDNTSGMAP